MAFDWKPKKSLSDHTISLISKICSLKQIMTLKIAVKIQDVLCVMGAEKVL